MSLLFKQLLFVLIAVFSAFVQAVAGFGGNTIAMPFGIILVSVQVAKPVLSFMAFLSGIVILFTDFKYINWKELLKMTSVMLVGLIFGLWIFGAIELTILLIIYAVIVLLIGVQKLFFPTEKEAPGYVQAIALGVAGIMQGLFVSGGSFLAVYSMVKLKDKREFRATVNAVWAVLNFVLIIYFFFTGAITNEVLMVSGICIVPTLLLIWFSAYLAKHIKQQTFMKLIYIILIISGAVLLISNL